MAGEGLDFEAIGEFFAAESEWIGDGRTRVTMRGIQLEVDNPLSVNPLDAPAGVTWPEQVFPASLAACFITTMTSIAERMGVEIESLKVRVKPILAVDDDGGFKFQKMIIDIYLVLKNGVSGKVRERLVDLTHKYCLISKAIKGNVEEEVRVH